MKTRKILLLIGCWAVGLSGMCATLRYTRADVWEAYEGFNRNYLDSLKYIYKTDTSFPRAVDRGNGAAAIWCQPIYWDMAMNAYRLARSQKDTEREKSTRR